MSNEEILENNKLIANFMGVQVGEESYNKSWGWLMSVVEKIEKENMMATVVIIRDKCQITLFDYESTPMFAKTVEANDKLKATWLCIVEFVKWYNLNRLAK